MQSLPVGITAVLWMTFMGIVFLFPTSPQTDAPDMNYSVVVLGGVLVLSIAWYYFPVYGGVHWFTGPVRTIDDPTAGGQHGGHGHGGGHMPSSMQVEKERASGETDPDEKKGAGESVNVY